MAWKKDKKKEAPKPNVGAAATGEAPGTKSGGESKGRSDRTQRAIDDAAKVASERIAPPIDTAIAAGFAKHPTLGKLLFNDATSWIALQALPQKVLGSESLAKFLEDLVSRSFRGASEKLARGPSAVTEEPARPVVTERDLSGLIEHILTTKLTGEHLEELSSFRESLVSSESDLVTVFDAFVWQCARRRPAKQSASRKQKGGKRSDQSGTQSKELATPATLRDFLDLSRERRIALLRTLQRLQTGADGEGSMTFNDHLSDPRVSEAERSSFLAWQSRLNRNLHVQNERHKATLTRFQPAVVYIRMQPKDRVALLKKPQGRQVIKGFGDLLDGIGQAHEDLNNELEKKLKALKRRNRRRMGR